MSPTLAFFFSRLQSPRFFFSFLIRQCPHPFTLQLPFFVLFLTPSNLEMQETNLPTAEHIKASFTHKVLLLSCSHFSSDWAHHFTTFTNLLTLTSMISLLFYKPLSPSFSNSNAVSSWTLSHTEAWQGSSHSTAAAPWAAVPRNSQILLLCLFAIECEAQQTCPHLLPSY